MRNSIGRCQYESEEELNNQIEEEVKRKHEVIGSCSTLEELTQNPEKWAFFHTEDYTEGDEWTEHYLEEFEFMPFSHSNLDVAKKIVEECNEKKQKIRGKCIEDTNASLVFVEDYEKKMGIAIKYVTDIREKIEDFDENDENVEEVFNYSVMYNQGAGDAYIEKWEMDDEDFRSNQGHYSEIARCDSREEAEKEIEELGEERDR